MPVLHIELAGYSRLLRVTPENRSVATASLANLSYRAKEMRMQIEDKDENEGAQASVFPVCLAVVSSMVHFSHSVPHERTQEVEVSARFHRRSGTYEAANIISGIIMLN